MINVYHRLIVFLMVLIVSACASAPAPTPTPSPAPTITPTPLPDSVVFVIQLDSSIINYDAQGPGLLSGVRYPGTFSLLGDSIIFVPEGENTYRVEITAVFDGRSVTAVNGLVRDALLSNLEVDKYPTGQFVARSDEPVRLDPTIEFTASGELTLHGRTRPVQIPFTLQLDGNTLTAQGGIELDLIDYEVFVPTAVMKSIVRFDANITAFRAD
jgi:polyisoprenoid-binding protein YceI